MNRLFRALSVDGAAVIIAFVVMVVYFSLSSEFFLTTGNLRNLLVDAVFITLIAAGMTYVLLTGGIDLSVGAVLGLSGGIAYYSLLQGAPVWAAVLIGVATGALIGLINGSIISGLGVNDFIVTLAMLGISFGVLAVLTSNVTLAGAKSAGFSQIARGELVGVPYPVVIAVIVVLLLEFVLVGTRFGRSVIAAGMSPRAAHLAGVSVRRIRFQVYVLSGAIAGLAGVIQASRLNSVQAGLGSGYELTAIAACVLGGVSLAGGRGNVLRAVVGALFLATLSRGLRLLGVDPLWFTIVTGLSIIAAIAFDKAIQAFAQSRLLADRSGEAPSEVTPHSSEPADGMPSTSTQSLSVTTRSR